MDMITQVTAKINAVFNEEYLNQLANPLGFIRRKRKIMAKEFLEKLITSTLSHPHVSLESLACEFENEHRRISKPGLHKKFNEQTEQLMQAVLSSLLSGVFEGHQTKLGLLSTFHDIILGDSSKVRLSSRLRSAFPDQRNAQSASVKLQAVMSGLTNQLKKLAVDYWASPSSAGLPRYSSLLSAACLVT